MSLDRFLLLPSKQYRKYQGKLLRSGLATMGYFTVKLSKKGKGGSAYVHRLVMRDA